jgi:hypothetical protein
MPQILWLSGLRIVTSHERTSGQRRRHIVQSRARLPGRITSECIILKTLWYRILGPRQHGVE